MRRAVAGLFAMIVSLAALAPTGSAAAAISAPAPAAVRATGATGCATEELKCRVANLVCVVVDCDPTAAAAARPSAFDMSCSFPEDPTGGEVCRVVLTVVGVVCRNHCLAETTPSAQSAGGSTRLERLLAIN